MVREPYSRLMSGYIDRLVTFPPSWEIYGLEIAAWLHPNDTHPKGHNTSFPDFIKYFIRSQKTGWLFDWHFAPMTAKCDPCSMPIDFITKLETAKDDMTYIADNIAGDKNITERINSQEFIDNTVDLMAAKSMSQLTFENIITKSISMCDILKVLWWSFKLRGYLPLDSPFPLTKDQCDNYKTKNLAKRFSDISQEVYLLHSKGKLDRNKQARKVMVELFLQVPLDERIQVRDILAKDFKLFGYDPQPSDLFPELNKS